jgi:hypothetical protein
MPAFYFGVRFTPNDLSGQGLLPPFSWKKEVILNSQKAA